MTLPIFQDACSNATLPAVSDNRRVRVGAALRAPLPAVADARRVRIGAALKRG
jgi:hypothetical protein